MIDWDANVLSAHMGVFGESITYTPAGGQAFSTTGVFDEAYREVDLAGGMAVTTDMPVVGVRLSQFAIAPAQGDQLVIDRLAWTFVVKEVRSDGHGFAKLMLNYLSP